MLGLAVGCALSVVAIWFGYPLVIAALARRGPGTVSGAKSGAAWRGEGASPAIRTVSVIIATRDTPAEVAVRTADILASDYPPSAIEIVVGCDAGGSWRPEQFSSTDRRVRFVRGDAPGGKASTLNAAVAAATGELLVFTDTAQRFATDTITLLCQALEDDPSLGAVSGALNTGSPGGGGLADLYWRFEKWLRLQEARVHSTVGVTGAVYAMRRDGWRPLPAGVILDDVYGPMDLVLRGHRVGFVPSAMAYDDRRFAPAQEFKRKARTLTGVVQLCAWLPGVLVPGRNPIFLQFLFHKLLRLLTPYLIVIGGVAGAVWVASILASAPTAVGIGAVTAIAGATLIVAANRRLREGVKMAVAMQAAVVRATVNGLRGEWDVWSR